MPVTAVGVLRVLTKVAPWVVLLCAIDERLCKQDERMRILRDLVVRQQVALARHSGDQMHVPHLCPN